MIGACGTPPAATSGAARKQRLVAVRQAEDARAQPCAPLDQAQREAARVEAQPERAARDAGIRERRAHRLGPAGRQPRVRVQEQDDLTLRGAQAVVELPRAAARSDQRAGARRARPFDAGVAAAAVDHPDCRVRRLGAGDGSRDLLRFVDGGDHHGDPHAPTLAD
jgi:hypothetical protein